MPKNPDPSLTIASTAGVERTLDDWTTMFQLCLVVLPGRAEANRYLPVARRIFATFGDSDATCAFLVTGSDEVARRILGDDEARWLTFVDPDNAVVDSLGLERLPALVAPAAGHEHRCRRRGLGRDRVAARGARDREVAGVDRPRGRRARRPPEGHRLAGRRGLEQRPKRGVGRPVSAL